MTEMKGKYREITLSSVVFGTILGVLMTMSFVYAGLKLGFTIGGSSIAAILGFLFLRGIMRKGTILENNINQTVASGVNISSAGIIFTMPALMLMGRDFSFGYMVLAATAGSFLGIILIIPLRRQMIEIDRLRFPTGTAVAAILTSPGAGAGRAVLLLTGAAVSLCAVVAVKAGLIPDSLPYGRWLGLPEYMQGFISLSLMNIGAGMLAGRGGLPFALGGMLSYWVIAPAAVNLQWIPEGTGAEELKGYIYLSMLRPVGIGLLIGGALGGVAAAFPAIKSAFSSLSSAVSTGRSGMGGDERISSRFLGAVFLLSTASLFITALSGEGMGVMESLLAGITGVVWIGISGLIVAECTGMTDISPISGLALIAVTLMMAITGNNVVVSVMISVAVCVATSQCADMMQDLKTGHLVGASPAKQQLMQFAVAWLGPVVAIATIYLLWNSPSGGHGFGPESEACIQGLPDCLSAPQAGALRGILDGIITGNVPCEKYIAGSILGGIISIFPVNGVAVLIGLSMYLPFSITLGFGAGSLLSLVIEKFRSGKFIEEKLVPLAAGLIIGEALTELVYSFYRML
jgi:putative OPT family oligopeptide transporter